MPSKAAEQSRLRREIDLWLLLAELLNDPTRRGSADGLSAGGVSFRLSLGTVLVRCRPWMRDPP
jgi:hypothetical protein